MFPITDYHSVSYDYDIKKIHLYKIKNKFSNPVDTMTSLQHCCDVAIQRYRYIVAMETSDDVAKTTSLQRLNKRRHDETLQRCRFCNVI